jgi:type VI secretion system secreted protein VgrG
VESVNGRLLVVEVDLDVDEHRAGAEVRRAFTAIPADTPFRAPRGRVTASPRGPQTGVVVGAPGEEIHPDATGRVRVQLWWDREGKRDGQASTWMRVGQFALGGSMIVPRIGWDVLTHHHEGDIDAPFVLTHLYDGQHPVPYALPANKTRTAWQTATTPGGGSTNELRFEDKAGKEEMFVNASKDMNVVVGDKKGEKIGNNHAHSIGANLDVKVGSNLVYGVGAKQDVSVGGSETVSVAAKRSVTVGGAESASIGGSRSVTVISGLTQEAKGGRTLTVGGTLMGAAAMEINRTAVGTMNLTVGGSSIIAAATGLETTTGGAAAETIGGAKIQLGASGIETGVKGAAAETVGGAYVIAAGGNAGESATGTLAITVGGAFLANAPAVEIEADTEISIRVGASSLTVKPGSIEVKAPTLFSPGAVIDKSAGNIHHN